jgi:hypothetical protein
MFPVIQTIVIFCILFSAAFAGAAAGIPENDGPRVEKGVQFDRIALVAGGAATFRYLGYRYVDRAWYQGQKQDEIRWINDWGGETYLNLDKWGHFMGGAVLAQTLTQSLQWSGFTPRTAAVLGTAASWAALLEVEMRDAHFDQWGFSIPDFVANSVGASVPLVHNLWPATQIVRFKFSYMPSALYLDNKARAAANRPRIEHLIDDYEGMTFWLTLAVEPLLKGRAAELWPDFLGVAVGYGANGLHGSNVKSKGPNKFYRDRPDARSELFLALDYDARYLPGRGGAWGFLKEQLNWLHLPAPAVRFYPDLRFYLLF